MAVDGRSYGLGAGLTWAETAQPHVAQCEVGVPSNAATSSGCFTSNSEGGQGTGIPSQPGDCSRDRSLEGAEVGTGVIVDVRLSRSCRRRSEARVGEDHQSMSNSNSAASSSQGPRRGWQSWMRNVQPKSVLFKKRRVAPAFGGRTSRSHEPPETINTIVSFSRCRDCRVEGQTRRGRRVERRCDPQSVEQAAGHVFCGKCKGISADARDQNSQRVERVVAGMPRG